MSTSPPPPERPAKLLCPALLVCAPASGQGKTTFVVALTRYYSRMGLRVRVFKCGPDFLDPMWHALASGAPVHPLDLWMMGEADVRARLYAAAQQSDLILVEGVMGLHDGQPSAAELAKRFCIPVLGIIDARSMAQTFGAIAYGLQHYQPGLRWAGVVANRVASARHATLLRQSLREPCAWLGAIAQDARFHLPSRYLGLHMASEVPDALARIDAMADVVQQAIAGSALALTCGEALCERNEPIQRFAAWQLRWAKPVIAPALPPYLQGQRIAIARDAAFCFIYAGNVECLQAMGATVCFFSPVHDAALPACDAVWLPGGYPELHASTLAANVSMRASLAGHIAAEKPLWAECGGMLALLERLIDVDGHVQKLWGLWPGQAQMHKRRMGLGMHQLVIPASVENSAVQSAGAAFAARLATALRGHTFHYASVSTPVPVISRSQRAHATQGKAADAGHSGEALYQRGGVRASFFHAWFASQPQASARLFLPPVLSNSLG